MWHVRLAITLLCVPGMLLGCLKYPASSAYFDSNGVRIYYTDQGNPDGDPVVLIHGVGANASVNWKATGIIKHLEEDYRVISFDLRGHGVSDKPVGVEQYGAEMMEDVVRLMDHLNIPKAHIVGYSLGSLITLKLLAAHPDRVISSVPCAEGWEQMTPERVARFQEIGEAIRKNDDYTPMMAELVQSLTRVARIELLISNTYSRLSGSGDQETTADIIESIPQLGVTEEELRANQAPVLSIIGSRDPFKRNVDAMTGVMTNHSITVIDGGDHFTTLLHREVKTYIKDFLDQHRMQGL